MNKFFLSLGLFLATLLPAQDVAAYRGQLSFAYSGADNGTFTVDTADTLSLAGGLIISNVDSGLAVITAFQHVGHDTFDLLFMYGLDTSGSITAGSWALGVSNETPPQQILLFIPKIDSATAMTIVAPLLDTTNTEFSDSLLIIVLNSLTDLAYTAIAGNLTIATVDQDSLTGSFYATAIQLGFPPPTLIITNGQFNLATVLDTAFVSVAPSPAVPEAFTLFDIYPNPFNPATRITFNTTVTEMVTVAAYNLLGEEITRIHQAVLNPGVHSFTWQASDIPAGIYFIRLRTPQNMMTRKVLLLK